MASATLRLRSWVGPKAIVASPSMPNVSFSWVRMCASSALRSSALEGMQPTLRQTPPQYFSSTTADRLAELRRADRGDVPAGAGAEDQDIEVGIAHPRQPSAAPVQCAHYPAPAVTLYAAYGTNLDPRPHGRALPALARCRPPAG